MAVWLREVDVNVPIVCVCAPVGVQASVRACVSAKYNDGCACLPEVHS